MTRYCQTDVCGNPVTRTAISAVRVILLLLGSCTNLLAATPPETFIPAPDTLLLQGDTVLLQQDAITPINADLLAEKYSSNWTCHASRAAPDLWAQHEKCSTSWISRSGRPGTGG